MLPAPERPVYAIAIAPGESEFVTMCKGCLFTCTARRLGGRDRANCSLPENFNLLPFTERI